MPTIHYRHLHQHPQPFVSLNSPSPFDAAPQIRCSTPQTTYPELEAEEPRAFYKRRQLAELPICLFIYLFSFPPPCEIQYRPHAQICLLSAGPLRQFSQFIYLLYIACSSAPSNLQPLPTLYFLYSCLHLIYPRTPASPQSVLTLRLFPITSIRCYWSKLQPIPERISRTERIDSSAYIS